MSTEHPSPRARAPVEPDVVDDVDVPDDPEAIFGELIARNDRVCRQCFRRLRTRERFPWGAGDDYSDLLFFVDEVLPDGARFDLLDREYYEDVLLPERSDRAAAPTETVQKPQRYCRGCGSFDTHRTPPETRSADEAVDVAANISVTLREYGVGHDWLLLLGGVRRLKQIPKLAGDDFEVFSRAVARAVAAVDGDANTR